MSDNLSLAHLAAVVDSLAARVTDLEVAALERSAREARSAARISKTVEKMRALFPKDSAND
jgi:hypothetical protein